MKFNKVTLSEWRQFRSIDIDFHPKVTIITGANGAGKSTILKLLSKHFGWHQIFLATPYLSSKLGTFEFKSSLTPLSPHHQINNNRDTFVLGNIFYSNNSVSLITIPSNNNTQAEFDLNINSQQRVLGLHINSHRPIPKYQKLQNIPTNPMNAQSAYDVYFNETKNLYLNTYAQFPPIYRMKEAIVSMAAFGPGNSFVQKNEKIEKLFIDFKDILKRVLPKDLGFQDLSIRIPDIVLETDSGEFLLDASSGGIMSIIDLAWQIFLYSHDKDEFVVTIDEPENHLHPSMQRSLLNDFVEAFPNAQFIVVTHSPFIVSSIKDSNVYALKYENFQKLDNSEKIEKKVVSHKLDLNKKAATANEILREVLGVPVTLPQWAEDDLQRICSSFNAVDITPDGLARLRTELEQAGLGEFYPEALNKVVESNFHD